MTKPQHSGHLLPMVLATRAPQRSDAGGGPRNGCEAEGSFKRGDAALVVGATKREFAFGSTVENAGEHHDTKLEEQIADLR